ncbi:MAG TPA: MoaD/ThiS family protein [Candidatus Sulfotelmatobacter sp.]|nr:MoaD/ThiS family protein [Candidatus Sulfotelmatobacter sp.]
MSVTVKFIGALRHTSGVNSKAVECAACSVKELVYRVSEKLPELRRSLVAGEVNDLRPNALILVNGREISILNGLDTALKDGDEIVFVPVVHGG